MPGHADVAFGHIVALSELQAVFVDGQVLLVTGVVAQGDLRAVALAHQFGDGGDVAARWDSSA
jgi:hypothetical protein